MSTFVSAATLLPLAANASIEEKVDGILAPFVDRFETVIFYPLSIGAVSFPIVVAWLIIAA